MCVKVNFCAAPSSRKSTVCSGLEAKLKQAKINADTAKEYSRQYIQQYGVPQDLASEFIIYENQFSREKGIANVSEVLLSDAPAVNTYIFARRTLNQRRKKERRTDLTREEYKILEELHGMTLRRLNWFDIIVLFPPDDPLVNDGTRTETQQDKIEIYNATKGFLDVEGIPYVLLKGTVDSRIDAMFKIITDTIGRVPVS